MGVQRGRQRRRFRTKEKEGQKEEAQGEGGGGAGWCNGGGPRRAERVGGSCNFQEEEEEEGKVVGLLSEHLLLELGTVRVCTDVPHARSGKTNCVELNATISDCWLIVGRSRECELIG